MVCNSDSAGSPAAWLRMVAAAYVPPGFYSASSGVIKREWGVCVLLLDDDIPMPGPTAHVGETTASVQGLILHVFWYQPSPQPMHLHMLVIS